MIRRILANHYVESGLRVVDSIPSRLRYLGYDYKYDLHDDFRITKGGTQFKGDGEIAIGEGSYLGRNSFIFAHEGYSVTIGKHCPMSHYVRIYTSNYAADQDFTTESRSYRRGDVEIGDGVWLCAFALITEGTTIGDGAVIGARAVVTNDIPPHAIAVGSPAKVIDFKSSVSESRVRELVEQYPDVVADSFDASQVSSEESAEQLSAEPSEQSLPEPSERSLAETPEQLPAKSSEEQLPTELSLDETLAELPIDDLRSEPETNTTSPES